MASLGTAESFKMELVVVVAVPSGLGRSGKKVAELVFDSMVVSLMISWVLGEKPG